MYNKFAKEWNTTRQNSWGEFEFARGFLDSKNILDAGCGNGRLVTWLRENNFQGKYLGVDSSEELLKLAGKNFPNEKFELHDLREFVPGMSRESMSADFDAIFCIAVLHHFQSFTDRQKVLQNFHARLCKDGKIFLTTWNFFQPKYWKHFFKNFSRDCEVEFAKKGKRFIHAFTKSEMRKLFKQAGFKNIKIFYAKHSQRTNFLKGRNLIVIAQK